MSDPPRSAPWYRLQFKLGTLLWLMLVIGMATAWWNDRQKFEARLQKLEASQYPTYQPLWGVAEILGAPDDLAGNAGKSWCPMGSQAEDWIEVGFDRRVPAATIDLYETYSIGCVKEVLVVDRGGGETSIWKGTDPTIAVGQTGLFQVPVPKSIKSVQRVKIVVDSVGKSPWPCLDAVGLTTPAGKTSWASSSQCSTVYGNGSHSASKQSGVWAGFW